MKNIRQVFLGIVIAIVSIGLIIGGFSLSLSEGMLSASSPSPQPPTPTNSATLPPLVPSVESSTPSPSLTFTLISSLTSSLTPSWTPTLPPTPTNCPPPVGWLPHIVQTGETLASIAVRFRTNVTNLQLANCLATTDLIPGTNIYVPPLPTQTPIPCGRPYGWIVYFVQPGDTLYHLSQAYGITVAELQQANCMGNSTTLRVGQLLYVPPWAPHTPSPTYPGIVIPTNTPVFSPTYTPVVSPTATPTNTPENGLPSDTPTEISPTNTATEPPIPTATDTPPEIPTDTSTPNGP